MNTIEGGVIRMKKRMLLLVMAMVFAFALKAKAEMVTFEFRGTITEIVNGSMGLGYAAHWGSPGDPFWDTFLTTRLATVNSAELMNCQLALFLCNKW